ncbi:MAG: hypothetical protein SOR74_02385 [Candidatus Faecivicinus sp.]|nr:hypothetical protein [Candidatus Faecivicinus sp.]
MTGKEKCRALRAIRERIAEVNEIEYAEKPCTHAGECRGTCPYCESQARRLTRELSKRRALGKKVILAGLCAGIAAATSGCAVVERVVISPNLPVNTEEPFELAGDVVVTQEPVQLEGEISADGDILQNGG